MIRIESTDGKSSIEVRADAEEGYWRGYLDAVCTVNGAGKVFSTETVYDCNDLMRFSDELARLHKDLDTATTVSLWSATGNVAIRVALGELGAVFVSAIVVERKKGERHGQFCRIVIDQTYLSGIARQAAELSSQ